MLFRFFSRMAMISFSRALFGFAMTFHQPSSGKLLMNIITVTEKSCFGREDAKKGEG